MEKESHRRAQLCAAKRSYPEEKTDMLQQPWMKFQSLTRIATHQPYDLHRVRYQERADEQSKKRNDCALDIGIVHVRRMELIRDRAF